MKKQSIGLLTALSAALVLGVSGCAVSGHSGHSGHRMGAMPKEAGQAAFGALSEIVSMLERDANTDWEKVDIDALREHLVDMNELTLRAVVRTEVNADSIVHHISGSGKTRRAIQAMVPAHAKQLAKSYKWNTATEKTEQGVILTISANDSKQIQRFKALGFFGVMATGSHHQMHHFQMATGQGHAHH